MQKHSEQRISQLDGITIDGSEEYENASDLIRVNRECVSNETEQSVSEGRMGIEAANQTRTGSQYIRG
jgi:hypothetical protein